MKRALGLITGVVAAIGFGVAGVSADYPVGTAEITTSSGAPTVGADVTLNVTGFCPDTEIVFTIEPDGSVIGTVTSSETGTATLTFPAPAAGLYEITATATEPECPGDQEATLSLASEAPVIPVTGGGSTNTGLTLGAIAVAGGVGLVGLAAIRRRRSAAA